MSVEKGQILDGVVSGITKFGAFIELPGGTTGLVHISEVADAYVENVSDYLKEKDKVKVKVLDIDERGRIGLSIKKAVEKPKPAPGQRENRSPRPPRSDFKGGGRPQRPFSRQQSRGPSRSSEPATFEDRLAKFIKESDEKLSGIRASENKKNKRKSR